MRRSKAKPQLSIDRQELRGLFDQQPTQQHAPARPHRRCEGSARVRRAARPGCLPRRGRRARALRVRARPSRRHARSGRDRRRRSIRHSPARRRPLRRRCRRPAPGASTAWPWRWQGCRCRCRHRRHWRSRRDRASPAFQATACRGVRAGAESETGIDPERQQAGRHAVGDMRGMDPERSHFEGPEGALVLRHPVGVRQLLPTRLRCIAKRGLDLLPCTLAEDLDAPRPVARDLAAGHDKSVLVQMFQRPFPRETLDRRDHKRRFPGAHAASMKLSRTFFGPAFSNSMSSLLPSTARMRP